MSRHRIEDTQELARRFNEEEAVWECFQQRRRLRGLPGQRSPLPEAVLDHLAWLAAEEEVRPFRVIAKSVVQP